MFYQAVKKKMTYDEKKLLVARITSIREGLGLNQKMNKQMNSRVNQVPLAALVFDFELWLQGEICDDPLARADGVMPLRKEKIAMCDYFFSCNKDRGLTTPVNPLL